MDFCNDITFLEHAKLTANELKSGVVWLRLNKDDSFSGIFYNDYLAEVLGYTHEELDAFFQDSILKIVYPADTPMAMEGLLNANSDDYRSLTGRLLTKSGKALWFLVHYRKYTLLGNPGIILLLNDINEMVGTQKKLQDDSQKWIDIINTLPVATAVFAIDKAEHCTTIAVNDGLVWFSNHVGKILDGNAREWNKEGLSLMLNQNVYAFSVLEDYEKIRKMLEDSIDSGFSSCTFRLRGSTEEKAVYIYSTCASKPVDGDLRNYYVTFQDVTESVLQEKEIRAQQDELIHLSYFDTLTGCKNRNAYNAYSDYCQTHRLYNVGIAFCDVNGLKKTNDEFGHIYGDRMLVHFARILSEEFSINNIYRISGDEFLVIQPEIEKNDFQEKMRHVLDNTVANNNLASIGYIWKDNVSDLKRRCSQAEKIMYVEKQRYYETAQTVTSKHRPAMLNTLLDDLKNNRYVMYLQPKAKIDSSSVTGAEALIRKLDEDGKVIPPYEFIPQLEREKLIPKVDFFMLENVCRFLEQLKKEGKTDFKISVNMSRVTLVENDYINTVTKIVDRFDFNRDQLEFEVTESNETMDQIRLEDYINQIKELGIGISLDDVGTDYSTLTMLLLNGVDTVKLDRSLIIRLKEEKARKLLRHIISMSHDLDLIVIAEGVETDEDRLALADMDCDMYQGYLLSRPIPHEEFKEKYL